MRRETNMAAKDFSKGQVIVYKDKVEVRLDKETVWLTQKQLSELFNTERSVITKHIGNIVKTRELERSSVCAKFAHTAEDAYDSSRQASREGYHDQSDIEFAKVNFEF